MKVRRGVRPLPADRLSIVTVIIADVHYYTQYMPKHQEEGLSRHRDSHSCITLPIMKAHEPQYVDKTLW